MRDTFLRRLLELATHDERIMLLTGDLGFGVLEAFENRLPKQYLNVGVAEQNMTAVATGLALEGQIVFTYSIGNFPTLRCLEQLRNDAFYHEANVKVVCIGGGFSYGQLGMSHHATEDLSILRALPGVTVCAPASDLETAALTEALAKLQGPAYLRLERASPQIKDQGIECILGKARKLRDGTGCTLIACGGIVGEALAAAARLESAGVSCRVLSMHTLKPLDREAIVAAAAETGGICTVEENCLNGGLGSAVAETCMDLARPPRKFLRIGLPDRYVSVVGDQAYLRRENGLDADSIARAVRNLLDRPGGAS